MTQKIKQASKINKKDMKSDVAQIIKQGETNKQTQAKETKQNKKQI